MSKNLVVVYAGGRGSGKTLSMSVEGALAMIHGKRVWSNYPIQLKYAYHGGEYKHLHSTVIDMPDLIEIQKRDEIRNGYVLLDEWNLFCNSRRSGSLGNIIFSGVVQLIRKRNLNFFITAQDFNTLDKNIRWQCDVTVNCFDLSFRYKNLAEGSRISQFITDWSGVLTGRPLLRWDDIVTRTRNSRTRILRAKPFFNIYETGFEYDVLDVMSSSIKLKRTATIVGQGGVEHDSGFAEQLVREHKEALTELGVDKVTLPEIQKSLIDMGLSPNLRVSGKLLKAVGFKFTQSRQGPYYALVNNEED